MSKILPQLNQICFVFQKQTFKSQIWDQQKEEFCFFKQHRMISLLALFSAFLSSLSPW